jgi:hypothetical protein
LGARRRISLRLIADGTVEFRGREGVRGRSVFRAATLDLDTFLLAYGGASARCGPTPKR